MPLIKPFAGLRPKVGKEEDVIAPPYDVLSREEAKEMAKNRPWSFLHISRPEIDLPDSIRSYDSQVYSKGSENLKQMINKANEDAEKIVVKTNEEFHVQMENRKKSTEMRIKQMKNQAFKDIKNTSVKIAINSVEMLLKNSLDKTKLNKLYLSSLEETKLALKKKSS